jgi:hypothetical protein
MKLLTKLISGRKKRARTKKTSVRLKGYVTFRDAKGWAKILGKYRNSIELRRELYKNIQKVSC